MMLEVQAGMVCRSCYDSERPDTERRKIGAMATETGDCASAERTVQASEETEEHWAAIEVVT